MFHCKYVIKFKRLLLNLAHDLNSMQITTAICNSISHLIRSNEVGWNYHYNYHFISVMEFALQWNSFLFGRYSCLVFTISNLCEFCHSCSQAVQCFVWTEVKYITHNLKKKVSHWSITPTIDRWFLNICAIIAISF